MGVTDASLDGYLSANLSSVAGGVGAGGRDRGKSLLRNRCDVGGTGHICWVATRQILAVPTALMARRTVVPNKEELLPGAVSARHNIPTGGVALASLGPFVSD